MIASRHRPKLRPNEEIASAVPPWWKNSTTTNTHGTIAAAISSDRRRSTRSVHSSSATIGISATVDDGFSCHTTSATPAVTGSTITWKL